MKMLNINSVWFTPAGFGDPQEWNVKVSFQDGEVIHRLITDEKYKFLQLQFRLLFSEQLDII